MDMVIRLIVVLSIVIFLAYIIGCFLNYERCLKCDKKLCPFYIPSIIIDKAYKKYHHFYVLYKLSKLDPDLRSMHIKYMILNKIPPEDFVESMYRKFKSKKM